MEEASTTREGALLYFRAEMASDEHVESIADSEEAEYARDHSTQNDTEHHDSDGERGDQ